VSLGNGTLYQIERSAPSPGLRRADAHILTFADRDNFGENALQSTGTSYAEHSQGEIAWLGVQMRRRSSVLVRNAG
jgi:hypothetical protein